MTATTRNLVLGQKQVDGIVFTPRWSSPAWVEADSLSVLFAYCLPREFADSGQQILGGSGLEVLESYALAATSDLMLWLMVIENEDENFRYPAAVGVICASDANEPETRVLSSGEQTVINNIVQQFTNIQNVQITNITQVNNIINNVTTNGTGTTTPSMGNNTGGNNTGGVGPRPIGGGAGGIPANATAEADRTPPSRLSIIPDPPTLITSDPEGARGTYFADASDDVDGYAVLSQDNTLGQDDIGGAITISCNPPPTSLFPVGTTTVQCTAVDQSGNVATNSLTITVAYRPPPGALQGEEQQSTAADEEGAADEEAPMQEEQAPPTAGGDEGGVASPPANDEGEEEG